MCNLSFLTTSFLVLKLFCEVVASIIIELILKIYIIYPVAAQWRSDGRVYRYIYPQNQPTVQIFMWLLVVFFSLTQDKLLLSLKLEWLVKIYTPKWNSCLRPCYPVATNWELMHVCVSQVLRDFPHATSNIRPEYLFDMIGPLRPRAFSIASSQKVCLCLVISTQLTSQTQCNTHMTDGALKKNGFLSTTSSYLFIAGYHTQPNVKT